MQNVYNFGFRFRNFLNKPGKVFFVCLFVAAASLFFNGTLWRIWGLRRDLGTIQNQIQTSKTFSKSLDMQIKQAKDPSFIERQAKDKLDMVNERDLVFVFSE